MGEKTNIKKLFEKFVENNLSKKEYRAFMRYMASAEHRPYIEVLMLEHWKKMDGPQSAVGSRMAGNHRERFEKISAQIEKNAQAESSFRKIFQWKRFPDRSLLKVAAAIAVLLVSALLFKTAGDLFGTDVSIPKAVNPDAVTLKLDNGNIKVIFADDEQNIVDAEGNVIGAQKGRKLNYHDKTSSPEMAYNELTVPYGNQFDLELSDGTQIKLNAGSWIRYPVRFMDGRPRKVFLRGEAYFDVARDEHRPFIVGASEMNVQVLGTEFNLSFYPEDAEISTVLVEGSVRMYKEGDEKNKATSAYLSPGQKASWHRTNKTLAIEQVDIDLYTAWKDGILLFRRTPFNNIRKKLERHFDVSIRNKNAYLETQVYTVSFKGESINEILDAFQEDTPFEHSYNAENNTITLTRTTPKKEP